jgi:hypothetical protein
MSACHRALWWPLLAVCDQLDTMHVTHTTGPCCGQHFCPPQALTGRPVPRLPQSLRQCCGCDILYLRTATRMEATLADSIGPAARTKRCWTKLDEPACSDQPIEPSAILPAISATSAWIICPKLQVPAALGALHLLVTWPGKIPAWRLTLTAPACAWTQGNNVIGDQQQPRI